ncbi:hypothetical protein GCM10007913_41450 [Devosia yakushimensis]|uniref:ATP-grasp domain-containing protein n=1 Tax=Devosia yakushimensis TaxID=470028 RepID=A0ABQ5UJH7_9HYPH|nr:ATP-grasp domain-containing protein [Devosia yakushimensis]GLQ12212.1 hypothetical protein GCM10007913_41450 [Devosia yakushimensis]
MLKTSPRPKGAIILAGSHGAIALARSLAKQGLDVWFVTNFTPLPRFSNAVHHWAEWPGAENPGAIEALEALVREHSLENYLLVPAADADVKLVAQEHARLSAMLQVALPDWAQLQWACDKALTYQRATELGIAVPRIYTIGDDPAAIAATMQFPVVLKPTMRITLNRFTRAKAWRADNAAQFLELYAEALQLQGKEHIVVQEYIPGGGENQYSYAGLWWKGSPRASFAARRSRQFPLEFSYTSTFVETVEQPDVIAKGEAFLTSIRHHGVCEIEFKRDPRSGDLKLLDVNPRPWSWFGLAQAAGVDFGAMLTTLSAGEMIAATAATPGIGWMFLLRDVVVAVQLLGLGKLRLGDYLHSVGRTRTFATFSLRDPKPGLVELPLTALRLLKRRIRPSQASAPTPGTVTSSISE